MLQSDPEQAPQTMRDWHPLLSGAWKSHASLSLIRLATIGVKASA